MCATSTRPPAATGNAMSKTVEERAAPKAPAASSSRPRSRPSSPACRRRIATTSWHDLGLQEAGLNRLIREGYQLLDLITYFTVGPKEARAWTITRGTKAPKAAGVIHTDFEKGFIRAETIAYDDFVSLGGEVARQGSRQDAPGRQGVRRQGRRRHALPLRELRGGFARRRCRRLPEISAPHVPMPRRRPARWHGRPADGRRLGQHAGDRSADRGAARRHRAVVRGVGAGALQPASEPMR